jgi:O-antigen ligase
MILGIPVYVLLAPGGGFLTENRIPIFFAAVAMSIIGGVIASRSDLLKRLCFLGFMATLVFPIFDINFFVDRAFVGVPSARGLYITAADLFALSLAVAVLLGGGHPKIRAKFPGAFPYLAYIAIAALSMVNMLSYAPVGFVNPAYAYGVFELFNIVKGLVVFWVMVNFMRGEKEIRLVLIVLMSAILIEAAVAAYHQYALHIYRRSAGTLGHSNSLAMFIGMILPVVLLLMLTSRKGKVIPWALAVLFVVGIALMLKTVARGGMVAMVISCSLAGALLVLKVRRLHAARIALLIILVGAGGAGLIYKFWGVIMTRFGAESGEAAASTRSRITLLQAGVDIWLESPVIGNGINSFPIEITLNPRGGIGVAEQHNLYLLTLCETGVLGLLAFFAIIFRVFQIARRLIQQNINPGLRVLSIGLACGMLHVLIESFFEFMFRAVFISYIFWMFAAMIVSSWYMFKDQVTQIQMARLAFARRMTAAGDAVPRRVPQYGSSLKQ